MQEVKITVDDKIELTNVVIDSTEYFKNGLTNLVLKRSKVPVLISYKIDGIQKTLSIKPHKSIAYWANIYFNAGIAMPFEKNKKYAYPKSIFIDQWGVFRVFHNPKGKKEFFITTGYSFFGSNTSKGMSTLFSITPHLSIGGNYYYKNNAYISMEMFGALGMIGNVGTYRDVGFAFCGNVRNNYNVGDFDFGLGLNISRVHNYYYEKNSTNTFQEHFSSLGISTMIGLNLFKKFSMALIYEPSFISLNKTELINYQYIVSLKTVFKL